MISWSKPNIIKPNSNTYLILLLINILLATFLSVLATVTTFLADDAIQGELALQDQTTTWITTLNLLGVNTIVPAASWFADRFGYKTIFALGVFLLSSASLTASFATNFPVLGISRFVEGVGTGFIFPIGLSLITQNLPKNLLPLSLILYICAAFGAGFAVGLPVAGYFTQFISWRYVFVIVSICAFVIFLSWSFILQETEKKTDLKFDFLGFFLFGSFICTFLIGLTFGPVLSTNEGWKDPLILSCFTLAFISFISFVIVEYKAHDPIFPLQLLKYPVFVVTCLAMFLMGISLFATIGSLTQYMLEGLHYERFITGKIGASYGISMTVSSILANAIIKKIPIPVVTTTGFAILTFSYFLNQILDWQTGPDQIIPIFILRGIGLGFCLGPATIKALLSVPHELNNKAATILTFFRQVGGTYGGTLISIIIIKRKIYHAARFSEQTNPDLPGFQVTFKKLYMHYKSTFLDSSGSASELAKARIIENLEIQAGVQAMNDAMYVFGWITLIVAIILAYLNFKTYRLKRKSIEKTLQAEK